MSGKTTQARTAKAAHKRDERWRNRRLTDEEKQCLAFAVNAFRDPANLPADGWTLKAIGAKGEANLAELRSLLDKLFERFTEAELFLRLAWILDNEKAYEKLCGRLDEAKRLLGNGSSEHPFSLELGQAGTRKPGGNSLLNYLRSGKALKTLRQAQESWKQLHASTSAAV